MTTSLGGGPMRKKSIKLAAVPVALALVAGACGSDSDEAADETEDTAAASDDEAMEEEEDAGDATDFDGATVSITGPERDDPSIASLNDTLAAFGETVNLNIEYTGDADWEANINTQVEGGNPPNISFFPQPGKLADFAREGFIFPVSAEVDATIDANWAEGFQIYGNVDGTQYGVPAKTDLKSLVWYQPARFEEAGYAIPETFEEFTALIDTIAAAGDGKPPCVGIESGQATGWTYTDWVEEMVLRLHGGDVYDQWVDNSIPFDDPQIVEAMQAVVDLWTEDNVFAAGGSIAATSFADNGQPLVDGQCWMHRQANFFAGLFPEGTVFADGSAEAVDVFYFPDINGDRPVLTAGIYAAAFDEDPATMAVMNFIATSEYAENRQANQKEFLGGGDVLSGYLSAANSQDPSVYGALEQSFLEILNTSELARFDGSDLMPADVGAGTFWSEGTSLVNGDVDAATAATAINDSWPS
ncbi:MAG: ABC transporter substrate-binding protein [Ilumatobacter sp.]